MNLYGTASKTNLGTADPSLKQPLGSHSTRVRGFTVPPRLLIQPLHRLLVITIVFVYASLLVAVLASSIATVFAYEGYGYFPLTDATHFLWTWGIIVISSFGLPIRLNKPSAFFVWLIYLVVFIPAVLIPPYALGYGLEYAPYQGAIFLGLLCVMGVGALPPIRFPEPRWSFKVFVAGLLIYSTIMMLWLVTQVGIPTTIPTFSTVYTQRAAFGVAIAGAGPVLYLIAWQTSVVNPLLLLSGLYTRRWSLAFTGVGLNVLMYALAGHKSHLLSSLLVFAVFLLLRVKASVRGLLVAFGAIVLIVVSQALWLFADSIYPISIFVRRMMMVPGMLSGYYFDYFSKIGFTYRFGPLANFFSGVHLERTTPRTIGFEYFNSETMAANANFWADSFSALGYAGIILASLLLGLVLWAMDSLNISRPPTIATPLFVVSLYSLTNSALPTSLLTHGILITVLAIWMMPLGSSAHHSKVKPVAKSLSGLQSSPLFSPTASDDFSRGKTTTSV